MDTAHTGGSSPAAGSESQSGGGAQAVNVERLAEAVYRLMLADLKLEQARSGSQRRRG